MTLKDSPPRDYHSMVVVYQGMEFDCKTIYNGWLCGACHRHRLDYSMERCKCGAVIKAADEQGS